MATRRSLFALFGMLLLTATPARAGVLEPSKASEVIHLRTFGNACPSSGGGSSIDLRTFPDGHTTFDYRVPPKRVLVVRRVDFQASPGVGVNAIVSLTLNGNIVATKAGTGASFGTFEGSFEFDPGLIVTDNSKLCTGTQNGSVVFSTLVGFLAKDK